MQNKAVNPFVGLPFMVHPSENSTSNQPPAPWVTPAPTWTAPAQTWTAPAPVYGPPAQTYPPAPTWTAPAPTFGPPTWALPPYYVLPAAMTAPALISNVAYSTSSKFGEIYDVIGNRYSWTRIKDGEYAFLNDQKNKIYSAMHVTNITGANEAGNGGHLYANFTMNNGESRKFQGLRLGDFVYFNYTNQDIYVGGNVGGNRFLLPPNNLYTLGQPIVPVPVSALQSNLVLLKEEQNKLLEIQKYQDISSRDSAIEQAQRLQQENTKLKIVPEQQLEYIKNLEQKLLLAQREIERLQKQNEYDRIELERRARSKDLESRFSESQINSFRLKAEQEARVAKDLAAERDRAAQAAAAEVADLRRQLEDARAAAQAAETDATAERAQIAAAAAAAEAARAAAQAERERAAALAAAETAALQQQLADAKAARAAAEERANVAEQKVGGLQIVIADLQDSLKNIKVDFEKFKSLFDNFFDTQPKKYHQINYKEDGGGDDIRFNWLYERGELTKPSKSYNLYRKFTAFSNEASDKEKEEDALTQIALLKIKLIKLGRDSNLDFSSQENTIEGYLSGVIAENKELNLDNQETQEFCKKYFLLGQQYKKIIDEESRITEKGIQKMMSSEFKVSIASFSNKNALEFLKFNEDSFDEILATLSNVDFSNISKDNKDKIILYNGFILSLEQACDGYKEVEKSSSNEINEINEIKITPELAKVFVSLEEEKAKVFWGKLDGDQQIQLRELIKKEEEYSRQQQVNVLGEFELKVSNASALPSTISINFLNRQRERNVKQSVRKSGEGVIKEVSSFFEEREEKCKKMLENQFSSVQDLDVKAETNPALKFYKEVSGLLESSIKKAGEFIQQHSPISLGEGISPMQTEYSPPQFPLPVPVNNSIQDDDDSVTNLRGHYFPPSPSSSSYPPTYESVVNSSQSDSEEEEGAGVWDLNGRGNSSDLNSDTSTPRATTATSPPRATTATSTAGAATSSTLFCGKA